MLRLLAVLVCTISLQAVACLDERFHQGFGGPKGMPGGTSLQSPDFVQSDNGLAEFTIDVLTDQQIEDLAIKLMPNPRVKLVGKGEMLIEGSLSHTVLAQVENGARGAIRLMVTGTIDGEEFLENRFVMVM
ncbi:hypothetical protein [Vibrio sp. WXL103]|uniref:hypothetical protein n=1 Tax=Vibrio sp. WXL103 TaxID=3450710 RepID=UPI003EC835EA